MSAFGLTILTTLIGTWAMFANGMTYAQQFSTILRTTKNADLIGSTLGGADTTGADPLPNHISRAKIDFRAQAEVVGLHQRVKSSGNGSEVSYGQS